MRKAVVVVLGVAALAAGAAFWVRQRAAAHSPAATVAPARSPTAEDVVLRVPRAPAAIVLDGDTDDPGWTSPPGPARTGNFTLPNGAPARPYSDARLLWADGHLYLALYAADEDVRTRVDQSDGPVWLDDSFRLVLSRGTEQWSIEVSPKAVVTDAHRSDGGDWDYSWNAHAHVSHDLDGTLNDSHDMDEEWVIEMAIPFESLGMRGERGEGVGFAVRRCDTPKEGPRTCASWGEGDARGRLVLD